MPEVKSRSSPKGKKLRKLRKISMSIMCIHSSFPDGILGYIPVVNRCRVYYNG